MASDYDKPVGAGGNGERELAEARAEAKLAAAKFYGNEKPVWRAESWKDLETPLGASSWIHD